MSRQSTPSMVATIGIDLGKNTFHFVGLDQRGSIVLQLKTPRGQLERRLTNIPRKHRGGFYIDGEGKRRRACHGGLERAMRHSGSGRAGRRCTPTRKKLPHEPDPASLMGTY